MVIVPPPAISMHEPDPGFSLDQTQSSTLNKAMNTRGLFQYEYHLSRHREFHTKDELFDRKYKDYVYRKMLVQEYLKK